MATTDLYTRDESGILEPPTTTIGKIKQIGPGFILSAAVVGSGELIATTALGAKAGFIAFWVILVSCLVKVTLQMEFGKQAIFSGKTVMMAFNELPGPRIKKTNWTIWSWLFIQLFKLLQVGGIIGGVGIAIHMLLPFFPIWVYVCFAAIVAALLIAKGNYGSIEKLALSMILFFTLLTFASLIAVQFTEYQIHWADIREGLSFSLPASAVAVAIAAFGITGIGGDEIMYYNYWCIEKGYARFTGPYQDTEEWYNRARGWIQVMHWDAILSMVVYTIVTAAFYLLGASILHSQGLMPEGYETIKTLALLYTESLGSWANVMYLLGAIVALFSTVFAALASWTRIFTDAFGQLGWISFHDVKVRAKSFKAMAWIFPSLWAILYFFIKLPVLMILIGGFSTSILLLIVVYAAYHFRYNNLPEPLKPKLLYDIFLWISIIAIMGVGLYSIYQVV
ncbi:Nramp family divalent metal transporter [Membranihabitans marinus]|uniref:Nramp family divalent metal transporter n=1 Tax=Membranihabitans marinus TaxID=1227546 RepID=UPI001F0311A6|nr:Nramp family divalent metal transporter [Membranihabitans marinus]